MTEYTPLPSKRIKDHAGQRFGRLTVIRFSHLSKRKSACWVCACDCGNEKIIDIRCLVINHIEDCGCTHRERLMLGTHRTHNLSHTHEYNTYNSMRIRCYDTSASHYKSYGGRGIVVCDRWLNSFVNFYQDMGPRPSPQHSIDRIDNDGPYSPDNCRWATGIVQANNKRNNHSLTYNGETKTLAEWQKITGIQSPTIRKRLRLGWSTEDALTRPIRPITGVHK